MSAGSTVKLSLSVASVAGLLGSAGSALVMPFFDVLNPVRPAFELSAFADLGFRRLPSASWFLWVNTASAVVVGGAAFTRPMFAN